MIQLGDYVTAEQIERGGARQGVFIGDEAEGVILVQGELDLYRCRGKDATLVSDKHIPTPVRERLNMIPREHGIPEVPI